MTQEQLTVNAVRDRSSTNKDNMGRVMPRKAVKTEARGAAEGKRYPLNMRTTFELRSNLEAAAAASGRSLAQEAEFRLERSFLGRQVMSDAMELAYGRGAAGMLLVIGEIMNLAHITAYAATSNFRDSHEWWNNPYAFDQTKKGIDVVFDALKPEGKIEIPTPVKGSRPHHEHFGELQAMSLLDGITSEERPDIERQRRLRPLLGDVLVKRIRKALKGKVS
jgi:hypothetical protein